MKILRKTLKQLKIYKLLKNDIYQQTVASTLEERDVIVSPYELLRDKILSEHDIVKRFANLDKFIDQYCRLENDDEDGNWYYCIDTNIKLLPTFFKDLVIGFNNNTYLLTLEKIYKSRGEKSGEGDKSSEDSWHETGATPAESVERAFQFLDWLKHRPERRVMIFTHGGVLKLDRFGGTRFLHGECRQYTFDGERMIRDDTYDIAQHVIPEDQMMLLKKKDMETLISSTTSTTESMGDQDGKEGGAKTAKT